MQSEDSVTYRSKIKAHIKRHQVVYAIGVTGVSVAGISWVIMNHTSFCGRITDQKCATDGLPTNAQTISGSSFIGGDNNGSVTIHDPRTPLSYIVSQDGTDNWWRSQAEYARDRGISEADVSKHFTQKRPLPNGESLRREGVRSAA